MNSNSHNSKNITYPSNRSLKSLFNDVTHVTVLNNEQKLNKLKQDIMFDISDKTKIKLFTDTLRIDEKEENYSYILDSGDYLIQLKL